MKRLVICSIIGLIYSFYVIPSGAQQGPSVPTEVCQAIEQYVAQIDSASAIDSRKQREALYASALKDLNEVLNKTRQLGLYVKASDFANFSEQAISCDPSDANFASFLEKKLQSRTWLQNLCMPYTTSR